MPRGVPTGVWRLGVLEWALGEAGPPEVCDWTLEGGSQRWERKTLQESWMSDNEPEDEHEEQPDEPEDKQADERKEPDPAVEEVIEGGC
eukprot:g12857.t1